MELVRKIGRALYRWWMAFARFLGNVNAIILLTIVYIIIIGPMSLAMRLLRKDLMNHRPDTSGSFWKEKEGMEHTVDQARRQF